MSSYIIDFKASLARLSSSAKRHYGLYVRRFLADCMGCNEDDINIECLDTTNIIPNLTSAKLNHYLAKLKQSGMHYHPINHTRSAVLLLARELADVGTTDYDLIERLKTTIVPHTEKGQDPGIWLTPGQSKQMLVGLRTEADTVEMSMRLEKKRSLAMIVVMLVCGLRSEEVTRMNWNDCQLDGTNHVLRIHGKGSKLRVIKLPISVLNGLNEWAVLCQAYGWNSGSIFKALQTHGRYNSISSRGIGVGTVSKTVRDAGTLIGIHDLAPHDLRRTAARNAYLAGASLELIRQMLGHKSILTTQAYVNAPLALNHSATDIVSESLSFFQEAVASPQEMTTSSIEPLLTRDEAAQTLSLSMPQFDRLRKRVGLDPFETRPGKTRPFALYRLSDIEQLKK